MVDTVKNGVAGYYITIVMENGTTANGFVPYSSLGNVASGGADSGNPIKVAGRYNLTKPVFTDGTRGDIQIGSRGALITQLSLPDNVNAVGFIGSGADGTANNNINAYNFNSYNNTFNGTSWDRTRKTNVAVRLLSSAATTNANVVKAASCDLHKIMGNNTVASKRYLKIYNKASAPTVGTDIPVLTFVLQPSVPFDINIGGGFYLSAGCSYAITGAAADADTTAIGVGDIECLNVLVA